MSGGRQTWVCLVGGRPGFVWWAADLGLSGGRQTWVCLETWVCLVGGRPGFVWWAANLGLSGGRQTWDCLMGRKFDHTVSVWQHVPLQTRSLRHTASLAKWLRRPPRERKIPGSNPTCDGIFPGSSHTSDLKIGTPVATLPGAWRYRVSAGTGWPGVSIL